MTTEPQETCQCSSSSPKQREETLAESHSTDVTGERQAALSRPSRWRSPESTEPRRMTVADLLAGCLSNYRVERVFTPAGQELGELVNSLRRTAIVPVTAGWHPMSAVIMAATDGRLRQMEYTDANVCGVCIVPVSSAVALEAVGSILRAGHICAPLAVIAVVGRASGHIGSQWAVPSAAYIKALRKAVKPMAAVAVQRDSDIPMAVRRALHSANAGEPSLLLIAADALSKPSSIEVPHFIELAPSIPIAHEEALQFVCDTLPSVKAPLAVFGVGMLAASYALAASNFIQKAKLFFVTTMDAKGVIDENSEYSLGTVDASIPAVQQADMLLFIGVGTPEISRLPPIGPLPYTTQGQPETESPQRVVIHISSTPAEISSMYLPTFEVIGNIGHTLKSLLNRIEPESQTAKMTAANEEEGPSCETFFQRWKSFLVSQFRRGAEIDRFPVALQRVIWDLSQELADDTTSVLVVDEGRHCSWFAHKYPAKSPYSIYFPPTPPGFGLSAAAAAKIAWFEKKVVFVCSICHLANIAGDLEIVTRLGLSLVIVVLSEQPAITTERGTAPFPLARPRGTPEVLRLAESFGGVGYRIGEAAEFRPLLHSCMTLKGVQFIDVPLERVDL